MPSHPDPYEIAYLRGGENEVTRVTVFSLIQQGYLQISQKSTSRRRLATEQRIGSSPARSDPALPLPGNADVLVGFSQPRTAAEIFQSGLPRRVKTDCAGYEQALRAERLLTSDQQQASAHRLGGVAVLLFGAGRL